MVRTNHLHLLLDPDVWRHASGNTITRSDRAPTLWPGSDADYKMFRCLVSGTHMRTRNIPVAYLVKHYEDVTRGRKNARPKTIEKKRKKPDIVDWGGFLGGATPEAQKGKKSP